MIDNNDKSTQALDLGEQPKRRGRPATGQALSNAERQKRYREAQKAQRNENMHKKVAEDLRAELAKALEEIEFLNGKNTELLEQLRKQKDQLAQRNEAEKRGKGLTYRKLTEYALDQLQENSKRTDVKTAKDWSFGSYLLWQSLAVTMNVQKAAFDEDREKMRKIIGLD